MTKTNEEIDAIIAANGWTLPPAKQQSKPNRVSGLVVDRLLFVSGHGPAELEGMPVFGKVGQDVGVDEARRSAEGCALNILSTVRAEAGSLARVERVVRLLAFVNCVPDFQDQAAVVDGASDVFHKIWGPDGSHTRAAIGAGSLPRGISVEIEAVFQLAAA
jgi:enamine deaminase RidA (YjgF/YER057c/UK114 family)